MKTKKTVPAQRVTANCQQQHENMYQPGLYWVEITDHGIDKGPVGVPSLWLEILPIRRDLGFQAPKKKDPHHVFSTSELRKPDPLAPYHDKRRVWLNENGCEYFGVETTPIRIRADVLLHSGLNPNSTDPHGLIGAHLKFECAHPTIDGRRTERWMVQGPKRVFRMNEYYN